MKKRTKELLGHLWGISVPLVCFLWFFWLGLVGVVLLCHRGDCREVCTSQGMSLNLYTAAVEVVPPFGPVYCTCSKVRKLTLKGEHYE